MSSPSVPARIRVPRFAEVAVERARLSLVPHRAPTAPRAPFVILVLLLLAGGVFGLLMFNTVMQQDSFRVTALQQRATALSDKRQGLAMELAQMRAPQTVAERAKKLGMVPSVHPAFVRLPDGKVLGVPEPAAPGDAMRITPIPPAKPKDLRPPRIIKWAPPRQASTPTPGQQGSNGVVTPAAP